MIQINNFVFQKLVYEQLVNFIKIDHVTAYNGTRHFTQKGIILATLSSILDYFL